MLRNPLAYVWPIVLGLLVLSIGIFLTEYYELAYRYQGFDKILHIVGGFAVGWFVISLFAREFGLLRPWVAVLAIVAAVVLVGVLWEFAEYSAQWIRFSHPLFYHYFHGGDLVDTLGDLLADLAGGASFALICIPGLTTKSDVLSSNDQSK